MTTEQNENDIDKNIVRQGGTATQEVAEGLSIAVLPEAPS